MKGLPFSESMMSAWLAGRKRVTRRLMKPQPIEGAEYGGINVYGQAIFYPPDDKEDTDDSCLRKPHYLPGETVYIKEVWRCDDPAAAQDAMTRGQGLFYKAGMSEEELSIMPRDWKSPRFMPEWASRSHALIVSVRAEQIQEITEEEAKLEGMDTAAFCPGKYKHPWYDLTKSIAINNFTSTWETFHPGSWARNDWVWRYELKRVEH